MECANHYRASVRENGDDAVCVLCSNGLNEFVEVNPDAVAKILTLTYHWTIAPYGNAALYLLGLFSEEPTVWSYISNAYEWNSTRLEFKHRINKNSFRNALTKEEHNQIFDTNEKEVTKCLITKLLSRC